MNPFPGRLIGGGLAFGVPPASRMPQGRLRRDRADHCMIRQLPAAPLQPLLFAAGGSVRETTGRDGQRGPIAGRSEIK
ncbi:hypothetical protein RLV_1984 (plasmid) [Rhizobium leguminosarum bv. viciae]|uniref:Uncharacterized protein n=1 Tax=Rhizobium leguminosarum TaxID=384 RepID=A0A179BIE4_RHILE|nr:hypothetical protein RLV_1984 [Rhizobium leguminosarum bv. viciae]OAP90881.1 hypothetical protein A4U53_28660 [Rhizobium leguminosarum]